MDVNNDKYVAGAGTTALGIIGTVLGGLGVAGNGNGSIPLLGGSNRAAEADAKIAKLEAERYTDAAVIASQARDSEIRDLETKNAADIKAMRTEFELRAEIDRKQAKIDLIEAVSPLANEVKVLKETVGSFTRVVIPASAVMGAKA